MWKAFGTFLKSLFPGIGIGLGALLSGKVFGLTRAEKQQNAFNAQQAAENRDFQLSAMRENNAFAADQAQAQMDFQEKMANTQWQRGVKDMQSAGLNPALAYGQGGASAMSGAAAAASGTPSGSAASGSGRGAIGSLSDIMQLAMMKKQLRAMDDEHNARVAALRGQELLNEWNPQIWASQIGLNESSASHLKAQVDAVLASAEGQRLANEWNPKLWQSQLDSQKVSRDVGIVGIAKAQQEISNLVAERGLTLANTCLVGEEITLRQLMQGLTSAQTVLTNIQGTELSVDNWRKSWENDFIKEHGLKPDASLWSLVTQVVGRKTSELRSMIKDVRNQK